MELDMALASTIRKKRLEKGFTQEELAFRCGIDRTYISLIERKKRNPTVHILHNICESLEISLTSLIQEVENLMNNN